MASGFPLHLLTCAGKLKNLAALIGQSQSPGSVGRLGSKLAWGLILGTGMGWIGAVPSIAQTAVEPLNEATTDLPIPKLPKLPNVELPKVEALENDALETIESLDTEFPAPERQEIETSEVEPSEIETAEDSATASARSAPNTLEPDPEDELLPAGAAEGKLSPSDIQKIRLNAARLDQEAETAYGEGKPAQAYRLWFRALRLLQYGEADEEIVALGRIGARAWTEGRAPESQAIAQRLLVLDGEAEVQTKAVNPSQTAREQTLSTQEKLALAHEQVGAIDPAIARYEWLLEQNQQLKRADPETQLIDKLTQLNLARLNYPSATRYTQTQLERLRRHPRKNPQTETQLVEQLVYLHEQNGNWEAAIAQQQVLLKRANLPPDNPETSLPSLSQNSPESALSPQRPALLLAIGRNQERAGLGIAATQTYQEAYRTAQLQQQFDVSHKSLVSLATIYETQSQIGDALTVYNVLRRVDELSYNLFGLLQTYERMGQLQLQQGNSPEARRSLQQARHIAEQLDYRVDEIQVQLSAIEQAELEQEP